MDIHVPKPGSILTSCATTSYRWRSLLDGIS